MEITTLLRIMLGLLVGGIQSAFFILCYITEQSFNDLIIAIKKVGG